MHQLKTLIPIYLVLVMLSYLEIIPLSITILGLAGFVTAVLYLYQKKESKSIILSKKFLILAFILILIPKVIPYIDNTIPIGYDAGIYKYGIENSIDKEWEKSTFDPTFNFLTKTLNLIFPSTFILTFFLILFELLIGFCLYITVKEYFNENTAILSTLFFSLSLVQFKAFTMLYYKNIIALSLLLLVFYFLKKEKYKIFTVTAILLAGMHRPTFLIFALSFLFYTFFNRNKNFKSNFISGLVIITGSLILYIDRIKTAILPGLTDAFTFAVGAGTFLNLATYKTMLLIYVPFLAIGLFYIFKNKKFNILFIWFLINLAIVVFELFFFNRYIVMLDLIVVVIVAIGLLEVIKDDKKIGILAVLLIFGFLSYNVFGEALTAKPLISEKELNEIKTLQTTEKDALVMATHKQYSPWVLGYSNRKTIAPGIFEENKWNLAKWNEFWASDAERAKIMLKDYERPLYIHVGNIRTGMNMTKFEDECFEPIIENKIYKVAC